MQIELLADEIAIDKKLRALVEERLIPKIDKLLSDFPQDEKLATIRIHKRSRFGFKLSFSMILPKKEHIFAETRNERLTAGVVELRQKVLRQVKEYLDKLRDSTA